MGKGSFWRKHSDFKSYNNAEIWDVYAKQRKEKSKKVLKDNTDTSLEELSKEYDKAITEVLLETIKEKGITDIGICGIDRNSTRGKLQILSAISDK